MSREPQRYVNIVPFPKIKKDIVEEKVEEMIYCRICTKGFLNPVALANHARMEHMDAYVTGNPKMWTEDRPILQKYHKLVPNSKLKIDANRVKIKTEEILSSFEPTSMMSLASNDVNYIIIKSEDEPALKRIKTEKKMKESKIRAAKKERQLQAISGPFECLQPSKVGSDDLCHQIFFSCCDYSVHYRDEHTRRRKWSRCQVCEKPLPNGSEEVSPYPCEVCGEGFETSEMLSEHGTIAHIKVRPHKCHICQRRFTQQGGLIQHMRMHTGDRPFACTFCPKAFTQKSGLDQHLRIHTKLKPYRCVVCSKTFCQPVHLKQHMRTHTNVAPFQCGICEKRYKQSSHLNYHLKSHNPAKMTEEQKAKYAELIGLISKEVIEIEIDQSQTVFEGERVNVVDNSTAGPYVKNYSDESWNVVTNQ